MKGYLKYFLLLLGIMSLNFVDAKNNDVPDIRIISEIKKEGYLGESFTYEIKLVSSVPDIANVRVLRAPSFPSDFKVIEGIVKNSRPDAFKEKGNTFYSWTIGKYFLIPESTGKFTVSEGEYLVFIPHEKIVYHQFWGNRRVVDYEEVRIKTQAQTLKIKNLPDKVKPNDFSGCVGDFKVEAWFPPGNIVSGKESYVVFTISGFGNLESFRLPNIYNLFNKGCHLKNVERDDEMMQRDGMLYNEVTLTCRFIPEEDEFTIDPLCLMFFNPSSGKYYESCSEVLHWTPKSKEKKEKSTNKEAIAV